MKRKIESLTQDLEDNVDSRRIQEAMLSELAKECECSVCLGILVQTTAVFPCGHVFCGDGCLENLSECPNCRAVIQSKLPSNSLGGVTEWLMKMKGFSDEDVEQYLSRKHPAAAEKDDNESLSRQPKKKKKKKQEN